MMSLKIPPPSGGKQSYGNIAPSHVGGGRGWEFINSMSVANSFYKSGSARRNFLSASEASLAPPSTQGEGRGRVTLDSMSEANSFFAVVWRCSPLINVRRRPYYGSY